MSFYNTNNRVTEYKRPTGLAAASTGEAVVIAQTARTPQATFLSSLNCDEMSFEEEQSLLAVPNQNNHNYFSQRLFQDFKNTIAKLMFLKLE